MFMFIFVYVYVGSVGRSCIIRILAPGGLTGWAIALAEQYFGYICAKTLPVLSNRERSNSRRVALHGK